MRRTPVFALATALAAVSFGAAAQDNVLKGKAAMGGWQQDKPGLKRHLTLQDQPPIGKDVKNFSEKAPMPEGAKPQVPPGFSVEMVATALNTPRVIRMAPNGDLFVAEKETNQVRVLRVPSGSAKPAHNDVFASGLSQPYGIAFYPAGANPEWIYIANDDGVVRFRYKSGDLKASGEPELIVKRIPWSHHWTRDIVFTPEGKLLLAVGSGSNVALDMFPTPLAKGGLEAWKKEKPLGAAWDTEERRAVVMSYDPDGKNEKIVATGLRNCSGLAIHPTTNRPWCVVNERDGIGDNTPFEYATEVKDGGFYGWPWFYAGGHEDPRQKEMRPGPEGQADHAGRVHAGALGAAADRVLSGRHVPRRLQGQRLRHAARLVESREAHRLQGGAPAIRQRRQADRRVRGLHDRLCGGRQESVGPPGRRRGRAGRLAVRHRGRQRHDLARDAPAAGGALGGRPRGATPAPCRSA